MGILICLPATRRFSRHDVPCPLTDPRPAMLHLSPALLLAQVDPSSPAYQHGYRFGVIFGALAVGALCGLIPLKMGQSRGQAALGGVGFVACVGAGFLLGLTGALPT